MVISSLEAADRDPEVIVKQIMYSVYMLLSESALAVSRVGVLDVSNVCFYAHREDCPALPAGTV